MGVQELRKCSIIDAYIIALMHEEKVKSLALFLVEYGKGWFSDIMLILLPRKQCLKGWV